VDHKKDAEPGEQITQVEYLDLSLCLGYGVRFSAQHKLIDSCENKTAAPDEQRLGEANTPEGSMLTRASVSSEQMQDTTQERSSTKHRHRECRVLNDVFHEAMLA